MGIKEIQVFMVCVLSTVVAGVLAHRVLPNWQSLVSDVGSGGAWFVSALYNCIYGVCIGFSAVVSVVVIRKLTGKKMGILAYGVVSSLIAVALQIILSAFKPYFENALVLFVLIGLFSLVTYAFIVAVLPHNKSLKSGTPQSGAP